MNNLGINAPAKRYNTGIFKLQIWPKKDFFPLSCYLVLIFSLFFSGCQFYPQEEEISGISISNEELKTKMYTSTERSHGNIFVSELGVGGITEGTLFNKNVIEDALSGLNITREELATEDEKFAVFKAYKNDQLIITIIPNLLKKNIASVWIVNDLVRNEQGYTLGNQYQKIYTEKVNAECKPGIEEFSANVICFAPSKKQIKYLFEGKWDGPDGELPPYNVLKFWRLIKIIWIAPNI